MYTALDESRLDLTSKAGINDDMLYITLRKISYVCEANKYPPLPAIVVNNEDLTPGDDFWLNQDSWRISNKDSWWAKAVRNVFLFNWGNVKSDISTSSVKRIRSL